ncbi:hypothetical protein [Deinococcus sp. YIM 77859]|uniref:hypothetical protein n=1 Tax=Deinococcus sp. YIM 77859 TaxID=1540221 RepID=UPI000550B4D4|nr:hypothetical protein [Deinococcus sp. YIM 77859]
MLAALAGEGKRLGGKGAVPFQGGLELAGENGVVAGTPVVQGGFAGDGGGAPPDFGTFWDEVGVGVHQAQVKKGLGKKPARARVKLALQVVAFAGEAVTVGV